MTKRAFLATALGAMATTPGRAQTPAPADSGAIAAQVAGRVLIALDGAVHVFQYFQFVDGLGSDLYSGTPSERTAHFTLRADALRPSVILNADVAHIGFQPAASEGLYRVYFNPSPSNRDFSRAETFIQGTQIATFRSRRTQATLIPGSHALVTGTADVVESTEITFRDRKVDIGKLFRSASFQFHVKPFALADIGVTTVSLPFGGHISKVA